MAGGSINTAREQISGGLRRNELQPTDVFVKGTNGDSVVSQPTTVPQWPLVNNLAISLQQGNVNEGDNGVHMRGKAPQRPQRSSDIAPTSDALQTPEKQSPGQLQRLQQQSQTLSSRSLSGDSGFLSTYYEEDDDPIHRVSETSTSRPSTLSSIVTLPEVNTPPQSSSYPPIPQSRRSANLGPPPSARRGASSYYSLSSFVTPIPEEVSDLKNNHGSYASSHAMPTYWDDGNRTYDQEEEDEDDIDGHESRRSDPDESTGLVRQASLGKQYRPALTTVRSNSSSSTDQSTKSLADVVAPTALLVNTQFVPSIGFGPKTENTKVESTDTAKNLVPSSSSGDFDQRILGGSKPDSVGSQESNQPAESPLDPRVQQILGGLEKGGIPVPSISPTLDEKSTRRLPRLDMDAVNAQAQRGSITSLPDLIRRATKLASNLERGKTASRLGMLDMFNSGEPKSQEKHPNGRSSKTISALLNSFPPPALNTPTNASENAYSRWPSPLPTSNLRAETPSSQLKSFRDIDNSRGSRRCCGMPCWAFVALLIVLLFLVAAAIVIPITLIVLPRGGSSTLAPAPQNLSTCGQTSPCQNRGTSLVSNNMCSCICVNGFFGSNCAKISDGPCSINATVEGYSNVTLGSNIPRLLAASSSNFSIPLNGTALLAAFSSTNLSCTSENALVAFGISQKRDAVNLPFKILEDVDSLTHQSTALEPRQAAETVAPLVFTSNGILFEGPTTYTPTTSASPTAATVTPSGTTPSQADFDFASVAVLYLLLQTRLEIAVQAQEQLSNVLTQRSFTPNIVSVSGNATVNFVQGTVTLSDGTVVGGKELG